eukprot:TRINITY_DN6884_c0_g1_i1.p1 TRINITY_DN6884_c0_g1~~TRINITY_DN6884_c0_g1_i1.p1  ORF type:complete len:179 (-),score=43.92 TRINITY_DN6884_c0_g1_i1:615-1151(-)
MAASADAAARPPGCLRKRSTQIGLLGGWLFFVAGAIAYSGAMSDGSVGGAIARAKQVWNAEEIQTASVGDSVQASDSDAVAAAPELAASAAAAAAAESTDTAATPPTSTPVGGTEPVVFDQLRNSLLKPRLSIPKQLPQTGVRSVAKAAAPLVQEGAFLQQTRREEKTTKARFVSCPA